MLLKIIWTTINSSIKASDLTNDSSKALDKKIRFGFSWVFCFWEGEKERERESLAKILHASNNETTYKTKDKASLNHLGMQIAPGTGISRDYRARSCWNPEPNLWSLIPSWDFGGILASWSFSAKGNLQTQAIWGYSDLYIPCPFLHKMSEPLHVHLCIVNVKSELFYKCEATLLAWYLAVSPNPK